MKPPTHRLAPLLLILIITLGFWRLLSPDFSVRWDIVTVHYNHLNFAAQTYAETHQLPLWNPYQYGGYPFIADPQPAIFYPPNLLLIITNHVTLANVKALLLAHLLLAGLSMYALLRRRHRQHHHSAQIALFGAVIFTFSGFFVGHASHLGMIIAYSWLPIMIALIDMGFTRRQLRFSLATAGVAALIILSGHMQSVLAIMSFISIYIIYRSVSPLPEKPPSETTPPTATTKPRHRFWFTAAFFLITFAFATSLTAIQLLPTADFSQQTLRSNITLDHAQTEALQPESFLTMIIPNLFNTVMNPIYWGPWSAAQNYLYFGIIPLIIVGCCWAVMKKTAPNPGTQREMIFLLLAAIITVLFMLGPFSFVQPTAYFFLPFFDKFRAPANVSGLLFFVLSLIAAQTVAHLPAMPIPDRHALAQKLAKTARILLPLLGVFLFQALLFRAWFFFTNRTSLPLNFFINLSAGLIITATFTAIGFFILRQYLNERWSYEKFTTILLIITTLDLVGLTISHQLVAVSRPASEAEKFSATQQFFVDEKNAYPLHPFRVWSDTNEQYFLRGKTQLVKGYNPLVFSDFAQFIEPAKADETYWNHITQALNVRYNETATPVATPTPTAVAKEWQPTSRPEITRNPQTLRWAWFVPQVKNFAGTTTEEYIDEFIRSKPHKIAFLEKNGESAAAAEKMAKKYKIKKSATAEVTSYQPNKITFTTHNEDDGFLVISEIFMPGWSATIDGQAAPLYRTDVVLRGLQLTAGDHEVSLNYRSSAFDRGRAISLTTLKIYGVGIFIVIVQKTLKRQKTKIA